MIRESMVEPKDLDISVENVVASASLDQMFDLRAIAKVFGNAEYDPKTFPGLVFRLKRPKSTTLIFRSGKMVCTGTKSEKQARSAVMKVTRELKKGDIIILGRPSVEVTNIVATANLHARADLEAAADVLDNVMYEPSQFPGLIIRMENPRVVFLVFASGKVVCTGARSEGVVNKAVVKLHGILDDHELLF